MNAATTNRLDTRRFRGGDYVAALMAELDKAAISERLQRARRDAGLTQQEMADAMHLHKRSVEDYESVKNATVPFDRLDEWARICGTSKEWLLHGRDLQEPVPETQGDLAALRAEVQDVQEQLGRIEDLVRQLAALQGRSAEA